MGKPTYRELLRDPRWQRKRLEILKRDNFTCRYCDRTDKTLHVHHESYVWGRAPWDYPDDKLETLCVDCHGAVTEVDRDLKESEQELIKTLRSCDLNTRLSVGSVTVEHLQEFILAVDRVRRGAR